MSEHLAARLTRRLDPQLDHVRLREQATAVLRGCVGYDLAVWATLDPATLMFTSCVLDGAGRDEDLETEVFHNEYVDDDVLKLVHLADGPLVGALSLATDGDVHASPRGHDVLRPRGLDDELRLVFSDGTTGWGALCLYRSGARFVPEELSSLRDASRPFAGLLRDALVRDAVARRPVAALGAGTPGLVVCAPSGTVLRATAEAGALFGRTSEELRVCCPVPVRSLVARHTAGSGSAAAAPTGDGRWLTLQATTLGDEVVVVVEPVRPHQLADVVVRGRGLTARERDVLALVARGRSNRQVASALALSEWTAQDHVKSLLAKFDVASRGELAASLFFDHYAAQHVPVGAQPSAPA